MCHRMPFVHKPPERLDRRHKFHREPAVSTLIRFVQIGIAVYGHLLWWALVRLRLWRSRLTPARKFSQTLQQLRMALSLLTLGLWIAASLLMQHSVGPRIGDMPLLPLVGYGLALWFTLRLVRDLAIRALITRFRWDTTTRAGRDDVGVVFLSFRVAGRKRS